MTTKQIAKNAKIFSHGILAGRSTDRMCFMVCAPLEGYFNFQGIKCRMVEGTVADNHHYWIELENGLVIDPTANQFRWSWGERLANLWCEKRPDYYQPYSVE